MVLQAVSSTRAASNPKRMVIMSLLSAPHAADLLAGG
jgi:hypothetical protein